MFKLFALSVVVFVQSYAIAGTSIDLSSLDISKTKQDWGTPHANRSVIGIPLTLQGTVYPSGLGTHANSSLHVLLHASVESFSSVIGIDDDVLGKGSVIFKVQVDGTQVYQSPIMNGAAKPQTVQIPLHGASTLDLIVSAVGSGIDYDHADWANAIFILSDGAKARPQTVTIPQTPVHIAHGDSSLPQIHGPTVVGSKDSAAFTYLIPATGQGPLHYEAVGLPSGLILNPSTGVVTGTFPATGETNVALRVSNSLGTIERSLKLISGDSVLARTPAMGWNSWNVWGCAVDDAKIRAAADGFVKSGLAAHGFQYINIDDCWQGNRDARGEIRSNSKFPNMKSLSDYIHSKGLKLGIYSSPGPTTCQGYAGSLGHETQDARTYADWGVDYLKYDWCSYRGDYKQPYKVMGESLKSLSRGIYYSFCQYGMDDVWKWAPDFGGNSWRTTGDIEDTWASLLNIGFNQNGLEAYSGPGHWNDPDMLVVGKLGWGPDLHDTRLTQAEQVTHITLWSMLSAPLLIGADLTQLDSFTTDLLTNDDVLAIDQDSLGQQAKRLVQKGDLQIWTRILADGSTALAAFNLGSTDMTTQLDFSKLGVTQSVQVRDLWLRKDLGRLDAKANVTIISHSAILYRLMPLK